MRKLSVCGDELLVTQRKNDISLPVIMSFYENCWRRTKWNGLHHGFADALGNPVETIFCTAVSRLWTMGRLRP